MNHVESRGNDTASGATTRQALTFALGQEVYGVDILRVKEIRGWSPVTRIPQSPPAVLGVLNLRGAIVPIVDLRVRFAMQSAEFNAVTVVIVLSLRTADGHRECGIVVDSVRDVVDIAADSVRPAPTCMAARPTNSSRASPRWASRC
jgi:purine-binding chemotaxis protein CheW